MINKIRTKTKLISAVFISFSLIAAPFMVVNNTSAATITGRKITLASSAASASTTYTFTSSALPTTGTAVKSVAIDICDSAVGTCSNAGVTNTFSASSAALASQPTGLGSASGWTVTSPTQYSLHVANAANSTNPSGAVSISWNTVTNPGVTNSTYYARVTTYSGSSYTGVLDTGVVALSTATQIQLALAVGETLTFCTGTTITGQNCGTVSGSTVDLGNGSTTATASGTSVMAASTNGTTGYTITVNGATLTSGSNTITALTSPTASSTGSSQFGLNLVDNTTPNVGTNVSGTGTATATTGYDTADSYKFVTGNTVASVAGPSNANTFTVSYIANISGTTPPGAYTATMTYIATSNF